MPVPVLLLVRQLTSGGSERQLTEVAKALDRSLWEPHVGCFDDSGPRADELRAAGVPIVRFPVRSFASWQAFAEGRELVRYVRAHRIRLLHSFDTPMNIFGMLSGAFVRDGLVLLSSQRAHRSLSLPRERLLLRLTDRLVSGVVVNCEAMRRHLLEDEGVSAGRIQLCYNGIDTTRFFPSPVPRPPILEDASAVIGCACVLRPEKGLPTLIDAFHLVRPHFPRTKLVLVGSGPMRSALEEQARSLGLSESVVFVPAQADVAVWMRSMDIFVLPSLSEALSNALMEAMACGCAVVASQVGGNPELAKEGTTGLTFPAENTHVLAACLERLLSDETLRLGLARNGSNLIRECFSIQASAREMAEIYLRRLGA